MKNGIIIILLVCIQLKGYSQISIEGIACSTDTSVISFANVSIKNKAIGACANERGYFKFVIDSACEKDTIIISSIGYINYSFTIESLSIKDSVFYLEPANYELKAAVIINNAPSVDKIIKHVLRNYGKNYPRSGYQAKAFFQDIVYNYAIEAKQDIARITEAAITMQEFGVQTTKEVKFRVDELRNS
ncbi:MAG: carboxypeptidase-like regulatory domain-containing protein [Bacteroidales bacterium]|nr:carboxypeptidase-like regulatory domain-containing protein [Bacteroidales bacterium]